jgi:hypothetical protein
MTDNGNNNDNIDNINANHNTIILSRFRLVTCRFFVFEYDFSILSLFSNWWGGVWYRVCVCVACMCIACNRAEALA